MDPFPYTSPSMFLEDGDPLRQARRKVFISGGSSKAHEDCAIAVCNDPLTAQRRHDLMHDISQYVVQEVHQQVRLFALHPHGVGIFKLKNASQRDVLIALNPHMVGPREITFHPHDEAPLNFRKTVFSRKCWIVLLGYPLDLKETSILIQVSAPFAKVLHWHFDDGSLSRVLLKVLVEDHSEIPRSLVIKMGRESDGLDRSWTVPIYIFNSTMLPAEPAVEENPPANNGDPHPFHDPVVPGEPDFVVHIAD
jgi:hypothetical protein